MYSSMVYGAVSFALGVYALHSIDEGFLILFLISSLLIIFGRGLVTHKVNNRFVIALILMCAGSVGCNSFRTRDNALSDYCEKNVYVTGRICDVPEDSYGRFKYKVLTDTFSVENTVPDAAPTVFNHKCTIYITSQTPYKYGETINFYGILKQYTENPNSSAYNSKLHKNLDGVFYRMFAETSEYSHYAVPMNNINYFTGLLKTKVYSFINDSESGYTAQLLPMIYLGISSNADEDIKLEFRRAGTWRFLYNGRIHCMIILAIFGALSCLINKRVRDISTAVVMLIYIALNNDYGAAMRAMLTVVISLTFVRLTGVHSFADTLSATVIAIGISNPLMLYDSGLILSVCSAAASFILYSPLYKRILRIIPIKKIASLITVYIIFMIALLPLTAFLFNAVSPYSILLTPIFFVLVFICFAAAPFYCIFGIACSNTFFFGMIVRFVCTCMVYISRFISRLPGAHIYLPRPTIIFMITWFLCIFILRYFRNKNLRPYMITIFIVFLSSTAVQYVKNLEYIQVHFVSVGQGDGAAVTLPHRMNILIDGGGGNDYSTYDPGKYEFLPYLIDNGITDIDIALVSHFHKDHVMGIAAAMENLHVNTLYIPDNSPADELRRLLIRTAHENNTQIRYINKSGTVKLRHDVELDVILPFDVFDEQEMNEQGALYRVRYGEFEVLFTGDIGIPTEDMLFDRGVDLSADILKVPHHGSANSSSEKLIRAVSPKCAVAGLGVNNSFGFPREATLKRYKKYNIPFLSTAKSGNILIKSKKDGNFEIYKN